MPPDLPPDDLRAWVRPYLEADRRFGEMIGKAFADARPGIKDDIHERLILIGMQRLIRDGASEAEARSRVVEALNQPCAPGFPSIDELDGP